MTAARSLALNPCRELGDTVMLINFKVVQLKRGTKRMIS